MLVRAMTLQFQRHQAAAESFFLFSFSIFAYAVLEWRTKRRLLQKELVGSIQSDEYYLLKAHQLRLELDPPMQSHFRVVACLLLSDGTEIWGTNDECSPSPGGAICAERAACTSYRTQRCTQPILKVFIVTDAAKPIPPGTLCREYLFGHPSTQPTTKVIMQSSDQSSSPWCVTLEDLYPYPSLYCGLSAAQQQSHGSRLEESIEIQLSHLVVPGLFGDQVHRLLEMAHQAALQDDRDSLHPIRYGAALAVVVLDTNVLEFWQAHQLKTAEYGASQDAVCQLLTRAIHAQRNVMSSSLMRFRPLALVQVDQYGIPHAPFAPARACLVEHGFGDIQVVVTFDVDADLQVIITNDDDATNQESKKPEPVVEDGRKKLSVCAVQSRELAPYVPQITNGLFA